MGFARNHAAGESLPGGKKFVSWNRFSVTSITWKDTNSIEDIVPEFDFYKAGLNKINFNIGRN